MAGRGHSCFRLTERGFATVVTDPYDHKTAGYSPLKLKADIVTVSHEAPGHSYVSAVKGRAHLISGPGEYEIGGVFITGVQTNGNSKRAPDEPRNTLYVFDYDGVTIAHLGDLRRVPSQTEIEDWGMFTWRWCRLAAAVVNAAKAVEVVSLLEPGIVSPMHYGTNDSSIKLTPVNKFLKDMGLGEVEPQPSLKIGRGSVPEETRVVVLSYEKS